MNSWAASRQVRAATDSQHGFTLSPCFLEEQAIRVKMNVQESEHNLRQFV
jgi:hypothetical protein